MKRSHIFSVLLLLPILLQAQPDSSMPSGPSLDTVLVSAFEQHRPLLLATASIEVLDASRADRSNKGSLVSGFNSLAGVRMEERSPGSYRINIRGSSLRSPFGVRNVKVYWNNLPFTDPGGNTYFNAIALNNFSSIEIFKGPPGSMYGAGTGGLILMNSIDRTWKPGVQLDYVTGSYGLQNILARAAFGKNGNQSVVSFAHIRSDGYRDHTQMRKDNASWVSRIVATGKQQLTAAVLFSDLYYQTPGGLKLNEFQANPRQARAAAGPYPSAEEAQAAIYQKNILAGLTHQYRFSPSFSNTTSLYTSFARIKNPTFRNYERRNEPSYGGRTSFEYKLPADQYTLQLVAGGEWQQGFFNTQVAQNNNGQPDTLQTDDDIRYNNWTLFLQGDLTLKSDFIITAGVSSSVSDVSFTRRNEFPVKEQSRRYKNEWSPRLALLKRTGSGSSVYASVSRGFSPPTVSELLPSTGVISTFLEAEEGTNYELGTRFGLLKNELRGEFSVFYFRLNHALVQRKDSSNADYYVNAGDTKQEGAELSLDYRHFFSSAKSIFQSLSVRTAQSFYHFIYGNYQKGSTNYSGKFLPSVPAYTLSILGDLRTRAGFYLNTTWYLASKIYLTDDNSVAADPYSVLGLRLGWQHVGQKKSIWNLYAGIDNLLDETYSLGNDINAAAGRYYNAAPGRNFYLGIGYKL